ncbi:MAG: FctA domain-containing protein, partial [Eubacteriales bacterium]|nr:FctA domain-containing protein [Eubacteriales bacterium]
AKDPDGEMPDVDDDDGKTDDPTIAVISFGGKEILTGKDLEADEFSYTITVVDENGNPVLDETGNPIKETVKNKKDGTIPFPEETFDKPGTYYYTVEQDDTSEPGITKDDTKYTVKVVVTDDGTGKLKTEVSATDENGAKVSPTALDFTNVFRSGSLQVAKIVTGTAGDKYQQFPFKITFGASGSYKYSGSFSGTISSGDTVKLKHGESIIITGLPAGIKYSVTETDDCGYTVTKTGDTGKIEEGVVAKAIFTNTKNASTSPKTGDSGSLGLWLAMLAFSSVGAPVTLAVGKKKRR